MDEQLLDQFRSHADMWPGMVGIFEVLVRADIEKLDFSIIATLLQAAFWNGVSAGLDPDFREEVETLWVGD